ncbi:hypothetical protein [Variovorax sp.]|uniref:BP74-related protein n=1 Tax=Variovorax sp. TaxID=1871043 RepID=UPI000C4330EC|nr:hypothetical protein [Variovorax sp.]MBS80718.1 calmodulin [Variovorax sp.]
MSAYFAFEQTSPAGDLKQFVFRLDDPAKIDEAHSILAGAEPLRVRVQGIVVKGAADYNPGWSFHLDPKTISFFEMQIEVCDANVTYVEDRLDEVGGAFLPKGVWCPWSSTLAREVTWPAL